MRNFIAPEAEISKVGEARLFSAPNNPQQAPRMIPPKREGDILSFPFACKMEAPVAIRFIKS
jgi:hypothetical protein